MHKNNAFNNFSLIIVFQSRKTKFDTTILRNIKKLQKLKNFIISKIVFRKHVRAIIINVQSFKKSNEYVNKITIEIFDNFQKTIEIYITTFFNNKCIIFMHYLITMFSIIST